MKHQELHTKRVKRTALRRADRYRQEAAFHKQNHQAFVKTLREEQKRVRVMQYSSELMAKNTNELRQDIIEKDEYIRFLSGLWLTRFSLFVLRVLGHRK